MKVLNPIAIAFLLLCLSCKNQEMNQSTTDMANLRFEIINYYNYPKGPTDSPIKYKLTYYFEDGRPHRWLDLDSLGNPQIEYIYEYDDNGRHIGARYKEPGMTDYDIEKVRFINDSTQVTEWIDSTGTVFYTMIDNLNKAGKTFRATFKGENIHGYDSTFYTKEGFEKRIFFTNIKGKVLNDRSFEYDSIVDGRYWVLRKKIMNDSVIELQLRKLYYDNKFTAMDSKFYPGIISSSSWSENMISFTSDENTMLLTRTMDWNNQFGFLSTKYDGIFTEPAQLSELDSIYNGCISPDGNSILYVKKHAESESIFLIKKKGDSWTAPIDLTAGSKIEGGYFYWTDKDEIYMYIPHNKGDIVKTRLINDRLTIVDSIKTLNTKNGTEFSPFIDPQKRFLIFTRYIEGKPNQQGFFVSYNKGDANYPEWSSPEIIKALPYGWGARIINNGSQFIFTNGENIYSFPVEELDLRIKE
ncbi:MAG: hypothetical protein KJO00_04850 [Bacteroidia bacterium]|nr:hypothetical protein [Bacteroidia bacterium]